MTTTTTETTELETTELESWLKGDTEIPCQMVIVFEWRCGQPSSWVMYFMPNCKCITKTRSIYICDECHSGAVGDKHEVRCNICRTTVQITWMERTK